MKREEKTKNERKEKGSKKLGKTIVKKFRLRHTLEIFYGEENSAKHFRKGRGERNQTLVRIYTPAIFLSQIWPKA